MKDLLADGVPLDVRQRPDGSVFLPGVATQQVAGIADVQRAMKIAEATRSVGSTNCNEHSSRSHSLLMVDVIGESLVSPARSSGRLVLVDLAGSERVSRSGVEGVRLAETKAINKSLAALGNVISALSSRTSHIPFRDSKLTWVLQDSCVWRCLCCVACKPR